jgi:hypothetical protein
MIAYARCAMGLLERIRNMLAGPSHIEDADEGDAAALHEEFGAPDEGDADVKRMAGTGGGGGYDRGEPYAASEGAEAAEADLETEEAPPDPDP